MALSKGAPAQNALVCENAEFVLSLSKGLQMVRQEDCGPALFNRFGDSLSGRHCMKLAWKICKQHGFARYRYEHGWCHEPNPDKPYEVADHANNMALYDELLPKRPRIELKGVFRRTHLSTLLLMAELGRNLFEDTDEKLTVDSGNGNFKEACTTGLYMHVFKYEDVVKYKDKFLALMSSDNMDSELQMAEDEFSMLFRTHTQLHLKRTIPVGWTLDGLVLEELSRFGRGNFSDQDIKAFFVYAKSSAIEVIEWQRTWHKFICDPQLVFVEASFFGVLTASSIPEVMLSIDTWFLVFVIFQNHIFLNLDEADSCRAQRLLRHRFHQHTYLYIHIHI